MARSDRAFRRKVAISTVTAVAGALLVLSGSSSADVTAVQGSAYGYYTSVSLFGGPAMLRGFGQVTCTEPNVPPGCGPATAESPSVALPATGGTVTDVDPDGAKAQYGPAVIFGGIWPDAAPSAPESGPISTDCTGSTGPGGSVTCNTAITLYSPPNALVPGGVGPGPFNANEVRSTCSATETDPTTGAKAITGSTTIVNGILETKYDPNTQLPIVTEEVPVNPAPNYTRSGTIDHVGDSYEIVFNEQITNPDGSLTVNAAHMRLLGPTAVGDMVIGSVTCGLTTVGVPTTTTTTTTIPTTTTTTLPPTTTTTTLPPTTTTTTLPPTTTTTTLPPTTTTTTLPPTTTTTTLPPTTTTTTLPPTTTTTLPPVTSLCSQLVAQRAAFNAQITAMEASLAQALSGEQLAAAIAQLEAARATGNAQFDQAIARCNGTSPTSTTTSSTVVPTTTTSLPPPTNTEICAVLLQQATNPFVAPFIQQLLIQYGCV